MTPDEAISVAFRAASREMARGMLPNKLEAYRGFVVQTNGTLEQAAKALLRVAEERPNTNADGAARLEAFAHFQILQATIGCLMALGHFPYLENIESQIVEEKLS